MGLNPGTYFMQCYYDERGASDGFPSKGESWILSILSVEVFNQHIN